MFSSGYVDLFRVMPSRLVPRFLPGSGKFGSLEHARSTALQIVLHPKNRARRATILRALDFQTQILRLAEPRYKGTGREKVRLGSYFARSLGVGTCYAIELWRRITLDGPISPKGGPHDHDANDTSQ